VIKYSLKGCQKKLIEEREVVMYSWVHTGYIHNTYVMVITVISVDRACLVTLGMFLLSI